MKKLGMAAKDLVPPKVSSWFICRVVRATWICGTEDQCTGQRQERVLEHRHVSSGCAVHRIDAEAGSADPPSDLDSFDELHSDRAVQHTAAIYQMLTGYTADNVSPSGQLEPPSPKDFPNFGCNIIRLKPPVVPMLPYVMMPRPLQESNVIGKAGTAGFLGRAYDPYYLYPAGDDMDMAKMERIRIDDLTLRKEVSTDRLSRRASLRDTVNSGMKELDRAVEQYALDDYYEKALGLVLSGKAREAFNLSSEPVELREKYGNNTFGQSLLLARRLVEAGTRVVEVNWPKIANSDNHSWDVHTGLSQRMKNSVCSHAGLRSVSPAGRP